MEKLLKKLPFYDSKWFNFFRFLGRHFVEDDCQQKAASLTYTTMLSIVPILTVLLMILSSVPALESVREQIYDAIYSNLVPQSSVQVSEYINSFAEKSANLSSIGAVVLFVTTIMTLTTVERAFNQIWRVEDRSGGIKSILRYWTIVTLGPIVLGTAFIVSSAVQSLSFLNQQVAGYGIDWGLWVQIASYAVTIGGFIGMYWFIPKAKVPIKNAAIAGIIVAVVFELLKMTFGSIMSNFTSYEAIYGAFAALPIFLLWIYLSWNLILLGVEISYTLTIFDTGEVYPRHPLLSLLDMLNLVYKRHLVGESVDEQELRDVLGRKELPKWYTYLNYLLDSNLITITEDEEYVLKKDLGHMTLWDFYRTLPYPLPIKDELDELDTSAQTVWLTLLTDRFIDTEAYAKRQLGVPLSDIFYNSQPRRKVENAHPIVNSETFKGDGRFDADGANSKDGAFEPEAFDKGAKVSEDNQENEAVIPSNSASRTWSSTRSDIISDTRSNTGVSREPTKTSSHRRGLFSSFIPHEKSIITEDDNPNKR